MYKIGVIGDRDSVLGFMALGFSVHEAETVEEAAATLKKLARDEDYAILFIVEDYAKELEEEMAKLKNLPTPAVICIPGKNGSEGYGMANMKDAMQRAVGTDILFKD